MGALVDGVLCWLVPVACVCAAWYLVVYVSLHSRLKSATVDWIKIKIKKKREKRSGEGILFSDMRD